MAERNIQQIRWVTKIRRREIRQIDLGQAELLQIVVLLQMVVQIEPQQRQRQTREQIQEVPTETGLQIQDLAQVVLQEVVDLRQAEDLQEVGLLQVVLLVDNMNWSFLKLTCLLKL